MQRPGLPTYREAFSTGNASSLNRDSRAASSTLAATPPAAAQVILTAKQLRNAALRTARSAGGHDAASLHGTTCCWRVTFADRASDEQARHRRVATALRQLEGAGLESWGRSALEALTPPTAAAQGALLNERVLHAARTVDCCDADGSAHPHSVTWVVIGAHAARTPDDTLSVIESALRHAATTGASADPLNAPGTSVWVWIDRDVDETTLDLNGQILGEDSASALPTRHPRIIPGIRELVIVHRLTRCGWRWSPRGWSSMPSTPRTSAAEGFPGWLPRGAVSDISHREAIR
jgi:hypothetical protein